MTGAFLILQGKMSANFRASYTETLGKLETQYCKLMVSELPALLQAWGEGKNPISYRAGMKNKKLFFVSRKPRASG